MIPERSVINNNTLELNTPKKIILTEEKSVKRKQISANILFGNPKSNCKGSGICGVFTASTDLADKQKCATTLAWVFRRSATVLCFSFSKEKMCSQCRERQFGTGYLTLTEGVPLPLDFCQQLKITYGKLKKGSYRVIAFNDRLIVNLTLI